MKIKLYTRDEYAKRQNSAASPTTSTGDPAKTTGTGTPTIKLYSRADYQRQQEQTTAPALDNGETYARDAALARLSERRAERESSNSKLIADRNAAEKEAARTKRSFSGRMNFLSPDEVSEYAHAENRAADASRAVERAYASSNNKRRTLENDAANAQDTRAQYTGRMNYLSPEEAADYARADVARAEAASGLAALDRRREQGEYAANYIDRKYEDNFAGQFGANKTLGRLTQDANAAWNDYLNNPTPENKAYAESIGRLITDFAENNDKTLADDATLPWISQSLANYLPQLWDQTKAAATGAAIGGLTGSVIPVLGTGSGMKAGITAASGLYSYGQMRGAAFQSLLDLGVDEQTARQAANDEALISSLIEMADTAGDLALLGGGKLIGLLTKSGVTQTAKAIGNAGAKTALGKIATALGKYGINVAGEGLEEYAQERVSIANENRMNTNTQGSGVFGLARDTLTAKLSPEEAQRAMEAAKEGAKIAAMTGAAQGSFNFAVATGIQESADPRTAVDRISTMEEDQTGAVLLRKAAEQMAQEGKIANSMAERILADQAAVDALNETTGLTVDGEMTQAQRRAAVKSAFERLASSQETTLGRTGEVTTPRSPAALMASPATTQDAADTFGQNGAKAYEAAREDGVPPADYYAGFAAVYQAGLSGTDMSKVRSKYAGQLTEAQKFAAYASGQRDASASLEQEKRSAQFTPVAGKESGLVYDDYVKQAIESGTSDFDSAKAKRVNTVAKLLGTRVRFVDSVREGTANAAISGADVLIEKGNENPVMFLLGHEWTHRMQDTAPEQYRAFRNVAAQDERVARYAEEKLALYRARGAAITYEQALDEAVADYAGRMIEDGKVLDDFIAKHRSDRTLLERIRDAIRALVQKLTGAERRMAQTAEGKLTAALEASVKQVERIGDKKNATPEGGAAQYSLNPTFANAYDAWAENYYEKNIALYVGTASDALQSIGVTESRIIWDTKKIRAIKEKHSGMTDKVIKQVPNLIENPILIMESQTVAGRITLLGDVYDGNRYPVMAALELHPTHKGVEIDEIKIASAYARQEQGGPLADQNLINNSTILYVDNDTEKVNAWLSSNRLQSPFPATRGRNKNVPTNSVSQSGEKIKTKFSMKSPVEETENLLALHNLTDRNLRDALELGGMPMPSIAVVKAQAGHSNYGPISLVFSKNTIDPKSNSKNRVYGGDAYTATAPTVDRVLNRDVLHRASKNIYDLAKKTADGMFVGDASSVLYFDNEYTSKTSDDILDDLTRNNGVKAAYLAARGKTLAPVMKEKANQYDSFGNEALQSLVESVGAQELAAMFVRVETGDRLNDADIDAVRAAIKGELEQRPGGFSSTPEQKARRIEMRLAKLTAERMGEFVRNAQWLHEDGMPSYEQEVDRYATMEALSDAAPEDAVREWVRPQIEGLLGEAGIYNGKERFTPSGNRKGFSTLHNSYTLENIVKAMTSQQEERGEATWGVTANAIQSVATPIYKSIKDIKADSGRLGTADESTYEAQTKAIDDKIMEIIQRVKAGNKAHSDNPFTESDIIGDVMLTAARGTKTVDAIIRAFSKESYTISTQTAQDIQSVFKAAAELPTEYFEAKPRRAVGFDEVLAAVVPDDMDTQLRSNAESAGMRVLEYKAGDEADRLEKVNSVEGARFSLKPVSPVQSTGNDWRRGATFDEVKAAHPTLFTLDADEADTRNPTQISGTVKSYRNIYDALREEGFDGTILDASSGLGYGTQAGREEYGFRVDDIEPFPDTKYEPMFTDYSALNKTYDVIINNAVLNVIPQDLRDALVVKIGQMLNPGGRAYINVRGTDVKTASSKVAINDDLMEYFISNTGSYQKGFKSKELVAYLRDALGAGFTVSPTKDFGAVSAIVTKDGTNYSLKGTSVDRAMDALRKENELLRERIDYWRGQTRKSQRVTTDKKAVSGAARDLIRAYGADLDVGEVSADLQNLYDYIASGKDGNDELTYEEARRRADEIARKLVSNAVEVDDEHYRNYRDLREYLRNTKLSISEEDSRSIMDFGDFRKRNFGRMTIGKTGTPVDIVYQELATMWPEFFDEQREMHPADQLERIADVMDGIYTINEYNPFSRNMAQAVTGAANDIMEMFFDLPQTRATFADKQVRKLSDAKSDGRKRVQQAIQKERGRREDQVEKLKTYYREKDVAGRERRSAREMRAKIVRHANALSQKLLRPSDKQHIPEQLRQATAAVLNTINLEGQYTIDPVTGARAKNGDGLPTNRTEAFRALRLAYADIAKDGGDYTLIIDPDLMDNLNELEAMQDIPLDRMSAAQLSTVWSTLKAVEASISTANKMLGASKFETISAFADGIKSDNIMRKDRSNWSGLLGSVDKLANLDMLTPQGYFHRMGQTGEELFRMMRSAQDRHITMMEKARQSTEKIVGKGDINKLERETHTFNINGEKLTMTTAQIMSLYELLKRKQAQDHIIKGGIRPDAISSGRSLRESSRAAPVHVTIDDIATITEVLTEEQIKIADGLQKYMGSELAELGNEASMEVYGYRKFNEKDYFPIQVDKNQTKKDIAKDAQAATIAGRGFTKSVTPKANNAVMVNSIFDVYSSHVTDMATYAAWLPTMENVRRIRDFTFRDDEGTRVGDVKAIIERVFGKNGNAYLNRLVDDINQGIRPTGTGNLTDGIVGNYKAAAVAANIRVIVQQPTAILRALNTLDAKYLLQGTVKRGDWNKVKKYAPIAIWKDWGYFDINTGREMKDVLLGSDTMLDKVRQAGMAMAGKADSFAWARLWNAVEAETRDTHPDLKPGTDAFYRAVADRFSEIVDQTQVVDGLLQRSQIMRSPDALTKMATSFMAEPTKTYNMFVNAVYDLRNAAGKETRTRSKKALARTTAALVTSFAVNAVMQSIVDAMRDDDKEKDYWEKVLKAYTGFTGDEESFLDYWNSFWDGNLQANFNPAGYLPYFKDVLSIAQGYDVARMDMEPISKVWDAAANMKKALNREGKYSVTGASANLLAETARLFGIPVANLKRDLQGAIMTAAIETDNYLLQYRIDRALLDMGYQGNTANFMDILYNASLNDSDAYEMIYADMVKRGVDEGKIRNSMERRMKDAQGAESVKDLTQRYLTPTQEQTYSGLYNRVASSSVWRNADAEQRGSVEANLYNLVVENNAGVKLREKIDGGAAYGIGEADYLLYMAALAVADGGVDAGKRNGSIDQDEAQLAIDMLTQLSDAARAYLWQSTNKGWKESKNPYK